MAHSFRPITRFTTATKDNLRAGNFVIRHRLLEKKYPTFYGDIMMVFDKLPKKEIEQTGKVTCLTFDKSGEVRLKKIDVQKLMKVKG